VSQGSDRHIPALLVFDADSVDADAHGILQILPALLAQDGRRAVVVRGIPVRRGCVVDTELKRRYRISSQKPTVRERWVDLLSATLDETHQKSLLDWAESRFRQLGKELPSKSASVIRSWCDETENVPLLIFLYSILTGRLREAARLGRHLLDRVRNCLQTDTAAPDVEQMDSQSQLTGVPVEEAVKRLQAGLGQGGSRQGPPPPKDVASALAVLAALGALRQRTPRKVLADIAGIDPSLIQEVILLLEKCDLASVDLPPLREGGQRQTGPLAPSAFYTRDELVGLVHPAYGMLIIHWLQDDDAAEDFRLLDGRGLMTEFLRSLKEYGVSDEYPIPLLQPIFSALKPTSPHVRFAEDIAMQYLRLQKARHQEELSRWQWQSPELVLKAFQWLNDQVVLQSASLLHSRGITMYKSSRPHLPLAKARERYQAAEADFLRGITLARDGGSERPVNILTSLGLLYPGWLRRERDAGNETESRELDGKVEHTLREALAEGTKDNPYAAYGLARYLVDRYERSVSDDTASRGRTTAMGRDLAEAIELLQGEPESYFEEEWNELKGQAIGLLSTEEAGRVVSQLKADRDELGFALCALRELDGLIPQGPTEKDHEVKCHRAAAEILREAEQIDLASRSSLAQLLRYALFSADPDRLRDPAYRERYQLIAELKGATYLDEPIWLFDYAMLSFQVGRYAEGADAFARLRRGQRFFAVSRDRSCPLTKSPGTLEPLPVFLRIISVESPEGKGWGRVEHPVRFGVLFPSL
jgi:hypothetical protein